MKADDSVLLAATVWLRLVTFTASAHPSSALYASYPRAVLKFTPDGEVTTLVNPVVVDDCDKDPTSGDAPFLRGLAVDAHGTIYAAATGCRCVIKITSDGHVETVSKAGAPWSPTGVALGGSDVFVLEYNVINDEAHKYVPRVRRFGHDGKVATLATFAPEGR